MTKGYDQELILPLAKRGIKVFFKSKKIQILLIGDKDYESKKFIVKKFLDFENWTVVHRNEIGVFHPKLFLLMFPKFLRVVIGSGNLSINQWSFHGNIFWKKDF